MRVLIAGFDLFRSVGGGQTFYRSIIEQNPQIQFTYLRNFEADDSPRPANATAVKYVGVYDGSALGGFAEPDVPGWAVHEFLQAQNIGHAAAGLHFDVVDTPDFERTGPFLADALRRHGGDTGKVVLSMHGVISTTIALNWTGRGTPPKHLLAMERMQYAAVDGRYFISPMYRDQWADICPLPSHLLDPAYFFSPPPRPTPIPSDGPPTLLFVGRPEKAKGPHVFVQMAWWLPADSYREAVLVGPEADDGRGNPSSKYVTDMIAERRLTTVRLAPAMTRAQLLDQFARRTVVVLPSLADTLNLVALEALFAGCPVVLSTAAGACRFLRDRYPHLPIVPFDIDHFYADLPTVEDLLRNYDVRRQELAAALDRTEWRPQGDGIEAVYRAAPAFEQTARLQADRWGRRVGSHLKLAQPARGA